jgi:Tol biopolymer transport system component
MTRTFTFRKFAAVAVAGLLGAALLGAQKSDQSDVLLQAAVNREMVQGDLKGAIEQYKKIADGSDKAIAAKALLRMAGCYEKLGQGDTQKTYERVVRDFADQTESAATARTRLAAMQSAAVAQVGRGEAAAAPTTVTSRRVWTLPQEGGMDFGAVSHDGRYIPFTDDRVNEELFLHDLMTGTDRRVTNGASHRPGMPRSEHQYPEEWSFSRDGKRLAYNWFVGWENRLELRVIDLQGTGIPQFRLLLDNPDVQRIDPQDWSPDGNWIAAWVSRSDSSRQIGLVSAQDGSFRVLKSVDGKPLRMFFSPDGQYLAYDLPTGDTGQHDIFILATDASAEIAAVAHPSNDVLAGWSPDGTRLLFTSDRSGSSDLWALGFADGKIQGSPQLIKRDVRGLPMGITASGSLYSKVWPGNQTDIHGASFDFAKGQFLSTPAPMVNTFVGANSAPEWSPDGKYLAYVSQRDVQAVIGIRTIETGQVRELSISPALYHLQFFGWAPDGGSFIATGATGLGGRNGIYKIDAQSGQRSLVVSPKLDDALGPIYLISPVLSPDGKTLYYVQMSNPPAATEFALVKRDLASTTETELLRRPALGEANLSPDGRYIAAASGDPSIKSNTFLIIPTAGGEPNEVIRRTPPQQPAMFVWGPDSRSLLMRIGSGGEKAELWRAFVDGAPAVKLETMVDGNVGSVRLHPDGRQIAFQVTTPSTPYEIWVTENFLPNVKTAK